MRVFVTGATGLVGANTVRALIDAGAEVRVAVRGSSNLLAIQDLRVERVVCDVRSPAALAGAFAGCEIVVHAAAAVWVGRTRGDELERVNVTGTRNVCEATSRARVRRLVHVSTVDTLEIRYDGVPADEDTPPPTDGPALGELGCGYVTTKRRAEDVVREHVAGGLDAVIVNPGYMFGPWDVRPSSGRMILEVARGGALLAPRGGNCFVDVRDVAVGIVRAIERGRAGRRYALGGENLPYLDLWTRIARIVGVRPPVGTAPAGIARAVGALGDAWGRIRGKEPAINGVTVAFGELPHYFSSARAHEELGYPATDLDRAITDAWRWFVEHGYAGRRHGSA